jgi:hypothetical protein
MSTVNSLLSETITPSTRSRIMSMYPRRSQPPSRSRVRCGLRMSEVREASIFSIAYAHLPVAIAWISWLSMSVLLSALSLGLFNASKDDIARNFAYTYAFISICVLVRALLMQHVVPLDFSFAGLWILPLPIPYQHDSSSGPRALR